MIDPNHRWSISMYAACIVITTPKISQVRYKLLISLTSICTTIWLFNIAMERSTMLLIGKPSISMGHLYHGYVSHDQMVYPIKTTIFLVFHPIQPPLNHHFPMVFLWFYYGFPMVFLWFPYGFPMVFLWFSPIKPPFFTMGMAVPGSRTVPWLVEAQRGRSGLCRGDEMSKG